MTKALDIFQQKPRTFSFELFPPKTEAGYQKLFDTIGRMAELKPDFISCTYGAGGGNRDKTFDIAQHIQERYSIPSVVHLTCVLNTKAQIQDILNDVKSRGIENILALRGDPPLDHPDWKPGLDNFKYSCELCGFIRRHFGNDFGIGVAGFPEGHPLCRDLMQDALYLKNKLSFGGEFVITQFFFDNQAYFNYITRLRDFGVTARILPGIIPIANYKTILQFAQRDKIAITDEIKKIFTPIQDDLEATSKAGTAFAIRQCQELLAGGAPGIHFYALNKSEAVSEILSALKSRS